MAIKLTREDYKAIAAMRRAPYAHRVRNVLERQLIDARNQYELTAPADEELRFRVLEIRTALDTLFVSEIEENKT